MKFPITVNEIDFDIDRGISSEGLFGSENVGEFVSIRPCDEKYNNKTYLGLFIGFSPVLARASYDEEKKSLTFHHNGSNPAIYVFDLKEVILGCGSWWGKIKSEEDLKRITDIDIDNVWYVKALKQLTKEEKK